MKTLTPRDHTLFARVTLDMWEELNRSAKREQCASVSELVRKIVAEYLTKQKRKR
jgi:metal-responsive CopG/Arc/MetJ family transcriptional regulator